MDGYSAYRPQWGNTLINSQSSAISPAVMCSTREGGDISYLIFNAGTMTAFVGYGPNSGAAAAGAVVPVLGTPPVQNQVVVPAGTLQTFTLLPKMFFAAVSDPVPTQGVTDRVFISPGDGI